MKRARKTGFSLGKRRNSNKTINKTKKYGSILVISLVVILITSLSILSLGGLFNSGDEWDIEEIMVPVDDVSGKINVLILGVDNEGLRTDTIVVASYDATNGTVNMLSIPRDTRMYIGSKYQKINVAHAMPQSNGKIKGPAGTIDAVTRLTGIPINYYVEFSFSAFRDTIDALGGVYFDVPQVMKYQDPTQDLYINLSKGYQLLNGDKAEQLVRFRRYPEGDIKRVKVQQEFIQAVIDQKLNLQIVTKIPDIYESLSKNVKTNLSLSDIIKYANSLLKIDTANVTMYELPGEYSGSEYKASYWLPDMKEIKLLVQNTFGYDTKDITSGKPIANAVYGKHTTEVLNPENVVVLQQDKHIAPTNDEKASNKSSSTETKKEDEEEKDDDSSQTKQDKNTSKNNTSKNESTSINIDNEEEIENEPDVEIETEATKTPDVPEIKPLDGMESSADFVRPKAN